MSSGFVFQPKHGNYPLYSPALRRSRSHAVYDALLAVKDTGDPQLVDSLGLCYSLRAHCPDLRRPNTRALCQLFRPDGDAHCRVTEPWPRLFPPWALPLSFEVPPDVGYAWQHLFLWSGYATSGYTGYGEFHPGEQHSVRSCQAVAPPRWSGPASTDCSGFPPDWSELHAAPGDGECGCDGARSSAGCCAHCAH